MKSLTDYLNTYRNVAKNLNLTGDAVELLAEFLANASYTNEVENVAYAQESMLERATLMNSKIQHCVERMYSVYRGICPRVILNFYSQNYMNLQPYDKILSGNGWNLYYIGYYQNYLGELSDQDQYKINKLGISEDEYRESLGDFVYNSSYLISPTGDTILYKIICILSPAPSVKTWTINSNSTFYFQNLDSNLSNDVFATATYGGQVVNKKITRLFQDFILDEKTNNPSLFDLTLPSYGSRIYIGNLEIGTTLNINYFKYCSLSDFNINDINKIKLDGTVPQSFSKNSFLDPKGFSETQPGLIVIDEVKPDTLSVLHYRANRHRFANSIIRSNSDVGYLLEEMYPNKVMPNGAAYVFDAPSPSKEVTETITYQYYIPSTQEELIATSGKGTIGDASRSDLYYYNTQSGAMFVNSYSKNPVSLSGGGQYTSGISISCPNQNPFIDGGPKEGVLAFDINYGETDKTGVLQIVYKSGSKQTGSPFIYTILPSISRIAKDSKSININIMRSSSDSVTEILTTQTQLLSQTLPMKIQYKYQWTSEGSGTLVSDLIDTDEDLTINIQNLISPETGDLVIPDWIEIHLVTINDDKDISREIISRIDESNTTVLDLIQDTVFLESDSTGKLNQSFPISLTNAFYYLYQAGSVTTVDPSYQTLSLGKASYEITNSGEIMLTSMENDIDSIDIPIVATYNGNTQVKILSVKKSISIYGDDLMSRDFFIGDDPTGGNKIATLKATTDMQIAKFNYSGGKNTIYIWPEKSSIEIFDIQWTYNTTTITNLLDSGSITTPALNIYYVPIKTSGYLTNAEINDFIQNRGSYYVSTEINVIPATEYKVVFKIGLELYSNDNTIDEKIEEILLFYQNRLEVDLDSKIEEIKSLISKIINVSCVLYLVPQYYNSNDELTDWSEIKKNISISYFNILYTINTQLV